MADLHGIDPTDLWLPSGVTSKHDPDDTTPVMSMRQYALTMEDLIEALGRIDSWGYPSGVPDRDEDTPPAGLAFVLNVVRNQIVQHARSVMEGLVADLEWQKAHPTDG